MADASFPFTAGAALHFEHFLTGKESRFRLLTLKRHDFLVKEGEVCPYFCYIESGIIRHAIDVNGDDKTTYLALRQSVTSSLNSFLNGTPSRKSMQALTEARVWVVTLPDFRSLLSEDVEFRHFYYSLIERQLCLIDDYRLDLLTLTPEERYAKLLASEPRLLREIPLRHLASFLGISDRHMSRIRNGG